MSDRELVARAIRDWSVCGATLNGETVFCDDPALPEDVCHSCDCFAGADAVLAVLGAAGRLRVEVTGEAMQTAVEAGNADTLFQVWADMLGMHTSVIAGRAAQVLVPIIAEAAERRVRAGLAAQMREAATSNRKLGNVDAAGIFDDIAKDLEAPHVG